MLLPSLYPDTLTQGIDQVARDCASIACIAFFSPLIILSSNPLLAETFEEPRMKFIAEKVSHRPVIMAYHAEGPGWEQYSTVSGKTKFWGERSLRLSSILSDFV